jgi:hypothetical protein
MNSIRTSGLFAGVALAAVVLPASLASAQTTVFIDGLSNPRGLTFQGNTLYVSESGRGGTLPAYTNGDGVANFYGATGGVSRRAIGGAQEKYIVDLPSAAGASGFGATGPQDVGFDAAGRLSITIGLGANPNIRQTLPLQNQVLSSWLGTVVRQGTNGSFEAPFDLAALEGINDYDGAGPDSNPFGLGIAGDVRIVADAGANVVTAIAANGTTRSVVIPARSNPLAPFGPPTYQAVPNGLTVGPDGDAYVTELTGFPFPPGAANIYRIDLDAAVLSTQLVAGGFTNLIDLAFGADGTLYALELDANSLVVPGNAGRLLRVNADGSSTEILGNIPSPTGLTVGPDGAWYISANGLSPTGGQVLRYVPEPTGFAVLALGATVLLRRRK